MSVKPFEVLLLFVTISSLLGCSSSQLDEVKDQSMNIEISLQVSIGVARSLHQLEPPTSDSEELVKLQEELGIILKPTFPGAKEPDLIIWFTTETSDAAAAEQVIARLQSSKSIEAAYSKPPGEAP